VRIQGSWACRSQVARLLPAAKCREDGKVIRMVCPRGSFVVVYSS
jgi:hypothetical protein